MDIVYDPALLEHMAKKGTPHVVVDTCSAKTCGGPMAQLDVYLASDKRADELREQAVAVHAGSAGDVLIMARGLETDDTATFKLKSFFGIKDVEVEGIYAYRF